MYLPEIYMTFELLAVLKKRAFEDHIPADGTGLLTSSNTITSGSPNSLTIIVFTESLF